MTSEIGQGRESTSKILKTMFRPAWGEVDEDGVLHFPAVFRYFKEAEAQLYRSLGLPGGDLLRELGIWMPRVETHCAFHSPIRYDQPLEITTPIGEVAGKTITYDYRIASEVTHDLLAEGYLTILIVWCKEFKPIPVPRSLRHLLNPYVQQAASGDGSTKAKPLGQVGNLPYGSRVEQREKPPHPPSEHPFTAEIRVASTDVDPEGLVHFAGYPYSLARAGDEFFSAIGRPRPTLEKQVAVKLFPKNVHFRFKRTARYGGVFEASLRLADLTDTALTH